MRGRRRLTLLQLTEEPQKLIVLEKLGSDVAWGIPTANPKLRGLADRPRDDPCNRDRMGTCKARTGGYANSGSISLRAALPTAKRVSGWHHG